MKYEKYTELYNKYEPWFGRPIEILTASSSLGEKEYKKFLLIDINDIEADKETSNGTISEANVVLKDLKNSQIQNIPLETFDKTVRLIDLNGASTIKLSNSNKHGQLTIQRTLEQIEFFIIQINSHFGKSSLEWMKVAENLAIRFNQKGSGQYLSSASDKLFLSKFIESQIQPVFTLSKTFFIHQSNSNLSDNIETIEIVLEELKPLNEEYEVTLVFEEKHNSIVNNKKHATQKHIEIS